MSRGFSPVASLFSPPDPSFLPLSTPRYKYDAYFAVSLTRRTGSAVFHLYPLPMLPFLPFRRYLLFISSFFCSENFRSPSQSSPSLPHFLSFLFSVHLFLYHFLSHSVPFSLFLLLFYPRQHLVFDGDECVGYLEASCLSRLYAAAMLFRVCSFVPGCALSRWNRRFPGFVLLTCSPFSGINVFYFLSVARAIPKQSAFFRRHSGDVFSEL